MKSIKNYLKSLIKFLLRVLWNIVFFSIFFSKNEMIGVAVFTISNVWWLILILLIPNIYLNRKTLISKFNLIKNKLKEKELND